MTDPIEISAPADSGRRYSGMAMLLHWLIAVLVIVNWRIAEYAEHLPEAERGAAMAPHFSVGMTIFALVILRLVWRWTHPAPPLSSTLKPWEATLARVTHTLFYVLLIGLPLGGWLAMSLFGEGIDVFGLFTIPAFPVGSNEGLAETIFEIHATGGTILLVLAAVHVLGALKHTFLDRDGELFRMLPFGRPHA